VFVLFASEERGVSHGQCAVLPSSDTFMFLSQDLRRGIHDASCCERKR
jgi:hypothetical protein